MTLVCYTFLSQATSGLCFFLHLASPTHKRTRTKHVSGPFIYHRYQIRLETASCDLVCIAQRIRSDQKLVKRHLVVYTRQSTSDISTLLSSHDYYYSGRRSECNLSITPYIQSEMSFMWSYPGSSA
ncbi:hypothetical protein KCU90_g72, partial [Aureobasidium melanogenum]